MSLSESHHEKGNISYIFFVHIKIFREQYTLEVQVVKVGIIT